jgi:hypothetical protein
MKILVMSAFILSTLTSAALADPQKPSIRTPVKLTDTQLDQIVGGQMAGSGTGIGTALNIGGIDLRQNPHTLEAITKSTLLSGIFPTGHGTTTAAGD